MGFDWERYLLETFSIVVSIGIIWPVLGILIDIAIEGIERDVRVK